MSFDAGRLQAASYRVLSISDYDPKNF